MAKRYDMAMLGAINLNLALRPVDAGMFERDVTLIPFMEATPGGDAMNEAITAARLGNKVVLCGKVGNDFFGKSVIAEAQRHKVDTAGVVQSATERTALGTQLVAGDGQRHIVSYRGALETYGLADVDMDIVENTAVLSIGSMFILKSLDGEGMREVLRRAKEAGVVTSADTMQDTYGIGFAGIRPCLEYLDYFLPSFGEAATLSGTESPEEQAAFFMQAGCQNVVVKMGRKGCFVAGNGGEREYLPECPGEPVDTTGAGDNFVAGFLTGVRKGYGIVEAARLGSATAAISVQAMGSSGAVKSLAQVEEYRKQHNY